MIRKELFINTMYNTTYNINYIIVYKKKQYRIILNECIEPNF